MYDAAAVGLATFRPDLPPFEAIVLDAGDTARLLPPLLLLLFAIGTPIRLGTNEKPAGRL